MSLESNDYGKVVKTFSVTCLACAEMETYSTGHVINDRRRCYKGSAEMYFRYWGWGTRQDQWLCGECCEQYDNGELDLQKWIKVRRDGR